MLEWKTIVVNGKNYIGMQMVLPKQKIFVISSTKCILIGRMFQIDNMAQGSCVFIMEKSNSFEDLLTSCVIAMNAKAKFLGYHIGMTGKEVLSYVPYQKKSSY